MPNEGDWIVRWWYHKTKSVSIHLYSFADCGPRKTMGNERSRGDAHAGISLASYGKVCIEDIVYPRYTLRDAMISYP